MRLSVAVTNLSLHSVQGVMISALAALLCCLIVVTSRAQVLSSEEEPAPPPDIIDQIEDSIKSQDAGDATEKKIRITRERVKTIRINAYKFRLAKFKLEQLIENRECRVAESIVIILNEQISDLRTFLEVIDGDCSSDDPKVRSNIAIFCQTERQKIEEEIESFESYKDAAYERCPVIKQ